ncbi:MAG TPA: MarR family transcriptional regulator [Solirubrobacteraceae bacterium]|nr:MarR family transcriptional regulator [Solirubrobacteraceae bacterium]
MEDDRNTRILRAAAVAVSDRGLGSVTLADVAALAGVSPRRVRELYGDLEECLLGAFDWGSERALAVMAEAYAQEIRWVDGTRAALAALLALVEQEPDLARLWIVYSLGAGPRVLRRRAEAITALCEYVDLGRRESASRLEPPAITAEGVVGALLAVLQARLLAPDPEPPTELLGELMSLLLLPYMGSAAAKRELARPPWRPSQSRAPRSGRSAVEGVGMRLTYRTARVLMAIAERPGASNREVADRAEVVDQGQISKLLSRLESQGLIANLGGGGPRGVPNAWELTRRGEQVEHALQRSSEASKGPAPMQARARGGLHR